MAAYEEYARAMERAMSTFDPQYTTYARQEIARIYIGLGDLARFRLHQPGRAIALYDAALRNDGPGRFAAADLVQFDLKDKAAAAKRYREILSANGPWNIGPDIDLDVDAQAVFFEAWLRHQIEYLDKGKVFSGALDLKQCAGAAIFMIYGAGLPGEFDALDLQSLQAVAQRLPAGMTLSPPEMSALGAKLAQLPSSTVVLMRTANVIAGLPDATSILAYVARNDPAGFASACYFELVEYGGLRQLGQTPANVKEAAAQFLRSHAISLKKGDPRKSDPSGTWQLWVESLRKGDAKEALQCLTPEMQMRNAPLMDFSAAQLREWSESFTGFELLPSSSGTDKAEAHASQFGKPSTVRFVRVIDEWKINGL